MKNKLKLTMSLGTLAAIAAPVVAISCGSSGGSDHSGDHHGNQGGNQDHKGLLSDIDYSSLPKVSSYDYDALVKNSQTAYDDANHKLTIDLASMFHITNNYPSTRSTMDISDITQIVRDANHGDKEATLLSASGVTIHSPYYGYGYYTHARDGKALTHPGFYHVMPQTDNGSVDTKANNYASEKSWNHPFEDDTSTNNVTDLKNEIKLIMDDAEAKHNAGEEVSSSITFIELRGTAPGDTLEASMAIGSPRQHPYASVEGGYPIKYNYKSRFLDPRTGKTGDITTPGFFLASPINAAGDGFISIPEMEACIFIPGGKNILATNQISETVDPNSGKTFSTLTYNGIWVDEMFEDTDPDEDFNSLISEMYPMTYYFSADQETRKEGKFIVESMPGVSYVKNEDKIYNYDITSKEFISPLDSKIKFSIDDFATSYKYLQPELRTLDYINHDIFFKNAASFITIGNKILYLSSYSNHSTFPVAYFYDNKRNVVFDSDSIVFANSTESINRNSGFLQELLLSPSTKSVSMVKTWNGKLKARLHEKGKPVVEYTLYSKATTGDDLPNYLFGFYKNQPADENDAKTKIFVGTGTSVEAFPYSYKKYGTRVEFASVSERYNTVNKEEIEVVMTFGPTEPYKSDSGLSLFPTPISPDRSLIDAGFSSTGTPSTILGSDDSFISDEIIEHCNYIKDSANNIYLSRNFFTNDGATDIQKAMIVDQATMSESKFLVKYSKFMLPKVLKGLYRDDYVLDYNQFKVEAAKGNAAYKAYVKSVLAHEKRFNGQSEKVFDGYKVNMVFPKGMGMEASFFLDGKYQGNPAVKFSPFQTLSASMTAQSIDTLVDHSGFYDKTIISDSEGLQSLIWEKNIHDFKWPFSDQITLELNWGTEVLDTFHDFNSKKLFILLEEMNSKFRIWDYDYVAFIEFLFAFASDQVNFANPVFGLFTQGAKGQDNALLKVVKKLKSYLPIAKGGN